MTLSPRDVLRELRLRYTKDADERMALIRARPVMLRMMLVFSLGDAVANWVAGFVTGLVFFWGLPLLAAVLARIFLH